MEEAGALKRARVPALSGELGGHRFYYFLANPQILMPMASVPRRRQRGGYFWEGVERSKAFYQRMLIRNKLREIERYLGHESHFFPNNVVLTFNGSPRFRSIRPADTSGLKLGFLSLPRDYGSVTIIDGQHRLFGYAKLSDEKRLIPVLAFHRLEAETQGRLFVDINSKQKKVDSNILWDLHEYYGGTKEAVISGIVKKLNRDKDSPTANQIIVPSETPRRGRPLTMTALCSALLSTTIPDLLAEENGKHTDESRRKIVSLLKWYLTAIRDFDDKSKLDWGLRTEGFLCTNNGISSFIFFLDAVLRHVNSALARDSPARKLHEQSLKFLETATKKCLDIAMTHTLALSKDERDQLRQSSSKGQQVRYAAELEIAVSQVIANFEPVHNKTMKGVRSTEFEELLQLLIAQLLREKFGARWYRQAISGTWGGEIEQTATRRGKDPNGMEDAQKLEYASLGILGQIILANYRLFRDVLRDEPAVFQAALSWMNAYRGGLPGVHTGETDRYLSALGRDAMGRYSSFIKVFLGKAKPAAEQSRPETG